ncbi:serine/threonine-protein kinase [Streptomyces sp. WMMB303]|uniref:serine/threonine-protein kinase n=1 Tax=Streptomyces sp. WMMB303 TaxID=3034154 RepID=UPI0023EAD9C1|nr:serine/threonine-protein kinase [Streptomyces sp. WMMB303]MDF4249291.1 serine/threonine-protein kinase [Streptomyces sp. WMMB303]
MAQSTLIHGRYRLLDLVGRGGMGEVWRARDESLGRRVAVKCLKPPARREDAGFQRVLRERFRREARVAASLQHRGVTVVHDFGDDDGLLYLVMELLEGRNLSQLLADNKGQPLPLAEVLDVAEQVAAALAYTHAQGVVHRDLKPANVMRSEDGTVKICDFGIARLAHDIGFTARISGTGMAMGTPHYMSPEQIADSAVDHRSDLYSFGCVLYEIATGSPPFEGGDPWAVLVGHRDTPPVPPRAHRPDLPPPLATAILRLLAKAPDDRPDAAAGLAGELAAARAHPPAARAGVWGAAYPGAAVAPAAVAGIAPLWMPPWTRGMDAGLPAAGRRRAGAPPDGALAAPAGPALREPVASWGVARAPEACAAADRTHAAARPAPARIPAQGAPPRERLADLADRRDAGLRLGRAGRWEEAYEVHRAVAAERELLLGSYHPDTLASRHETGTALARSGRHPEALEEYARTAADCAGVLGPDHPDTLAVRHELGHALGRLGRWEEALEVHRQLAFVREQALGSADPATVASRNEEAHCLERLGRRSEADEVYRELARGC